MERMAWTDDRLEERFDGIDRRFDEVARRFTEVDRRFDEVDRKFELVDRRFDRVEGAIVDLRHEMGELQKTLNRVGSGIIVALIGVIAAILVSGGA
ncbi:MAG: hypothetical protein WD827_08390 [Solirubrobacterales bacterium]